MKPGIYTRTNKVIIDACIFSISFFIAYLIRFEGLPPWAALKQFLLWFPYLVAARIYINWKLGIYRSIWRYVSLPDAISMARSMSIVSAFLLVLRFLYPISVPFAFWLKVPLSVIVLEYCLSLGGCMGVRALRRLRYQGGGNGNGSFREVYPNIAGGRGAGGRSPRQRDGGEPAG